ncbi:MAG: hypothetical protein CM1200mP20_02760 [Pseudomonadota bacterium]|nr:MAG: hypothetical protein CM1200mP20_02760 [Pseudomonadota bacterium]
MLQTVRFSWPMPTSCGRLQLISTERGFDPRDYVLVPFGGAGPLHAASVASDLGVSEVVVPPSAGVVSAFGLIASDFPPVLQPDPPAGGR